MKVVKLCMLMMIVAGASVAQTVIPMDKDGLLNGEGMGLASVAEFNGYPGPKHAIAQKDELGISPDQMKIIVDLANGVEVSAKLKGEDIVAAESELAKMFETGAATEKGVKAKLQEIGKLRAELRYLHLQAHLRMKQILSANQIARYKELQPHEAK